MTARQLPLALDRPTLTPADWARLGAQMARVLRLMVDGQERTLREIAAVTGDPEASISARLRDINNDEKTNQVYRMRRRDLGRGRHLYRVERLEAC